MFFSRLYNNLQEILYYIIVDLYCCYQNISHYVSRIGYSVAYNSQYFTVLQYFAYNNKYTILLHQEERDNKILEANLQHQTSFLDVTDELKSLAGPNSNFHGSQLKVKDICMFLDFPFDYETKLNIINKEIENLVFSLDDTIHLS